MSPSRPPAAPATTLPFPTPGPRLAEGLDSPPALPTDQVAVLRRWRIAAILTEPGVSLLERVNRLDALMTGAECANAVRLYVDPADFER